MTNSRERLSAADAKLVTLVEEAVPALRHASALVERFQTMLRSKQSAAADRWIGDTVASLLTAFAKGIAFDRDAVVAAITKPWSIGQTEGQITKLELLRRQMCDRASRDLLRARLCTA
jgi:transposase